MTSCHKHVLLVISDSQDNFYIALYICIMHMPFSCKWANCSSWDSALHQLTNRHCYHNYHCLLVAFSYSSEILIRTSFPVQHCVWCMPICSRMSSCKSSVTGCLCILSQTQLLFAIILVHHVYWWWHWICCTQAWRWNFFIFWALLAILNRQVLWPFNTFRTVDCMMTRISAWYMVYRSVNLLLCSF
jgi:hypothetical protein